LSSLFPTKNDILLCAGNEWSSQKEHLCENI
jgi:hypothetical protein